MEESIFYHVDVNSAFLSWEAARRLRLNPSAVDIREIPAVIGGDQSRRHGIVLAKSIPAKKYGITTGEPIATAVKKCPNLQLIKPDYELYVENSRMLMNLLKQYAPAVEPFSVDEAFCDMTGTGRLYGDPVAFACRLKDEIKDSFGFTVNIGIGPNRLLAKMASDFQKPDRVHTLFKEEIPDKMWPLPVEDLLFVGKNTASKLHHLGIHTIGQLALCDPALLSGHLKKQGITAWQYANGRCDDFGADHTIANKGYSNSTTLSSDITSATIAKQVLLSLCETVGARLRADNARISVIAVTIRNCDFQNTSKQTSLYSSTNVTDEIYQQVCRLFDELWDGSPIRLLGVSTSKATQTDNYQYDLFCSQQHEKLKKLDSAVDNIRARYGEGSIKRATFLDKP
ncbi:MAG: DNA polymerase IV [Lachnospiraceae bacterium]